MLEKVNSLVKKVNEFTPASEEEINSFKIEYLGKNGILNELFSAFSLVPNNQKKVFGAAINKLKALVQNKVEKYKDQNIDINLDFFRSLPINFNDDFIRYFSLLTGVYPDLSLPSLFVKENKQFENKVIIIRSTKRKNIFINYRFLIDYKDLIFIGLKDEYLDLKKEVSNLEFYECKNFLEMAEIIKSGKFFLGNMSLGFALAEILKVPRLLENFPEYNVVNPHGPNAYDFYFQDHFEKLFKDLYNLKN